MLQTFKHDAEAVPATIYPPARVVIYDDSESKKTGGFLGRFLRYLKPKQDSHPLTSEGALYLVCKEQSKDLHIHTSVLATSCRTEKNSRPLSIQLQSKVSALQLEIYLDGSNLDVSNFCVDGILKHRRQAKTLSERPLNFTLTEKQLLTLDRPTYWLQLEISLSDAQIGDEIEIHFEKVERNGSLKSDLIVSDLKPISETSHRPPIIIISLDGISAEDCLHLEGFRKWSECSLQYSNAISSSTVTASSAASLITGLSLSRHLLFDYERWFYDPELRAFSPSILSLGEAARTMGYLTEALTVFSKWRPHYGYARGFNRFQNVCSGPIQNFDFVGKSLSLLRQARKTSSLVLLHLPGAHPPFRPRFQLGTDNLEKTAYLSTLDQVDSFLLSAYSTLKETNLFDQALVIITSDHGRSVSPYSRRGYQFQEARLRIPFLVKAPQGFSTSHKKTNAHLSATTEIYSLIHEVTKSPLPTYYADASQRDTGSVYWASETIDYSNYKRLGLVGYDADHKWVIFFEFDSATGQVGRALQTECFGLNEKRIAESDDLISKISDVRKRQVLSEAEIFMKMGEEFARRCPPLPQGTYTEFRKAGPRATKAKSAE